jgi:hypothetical protein
MAGVHSSEYLIPREQCSSLLEDLKNHFAIDFVQGEFGDGELLVEFDHPLKKFHPPMLCFWSISKEEELRRLDLGWINEEEDFATMSGNIVELHGGTRMPRRTNGKCQN